MSITLGKRVNGKYTERKSRKRKFSFTNSNNNDNDNGNGISYDWVQPVTVSGKLTLLQVLELVSSQFKDPVQIFRNFNENALSSRLVPRILDLTLTRDQQYPLELINSLNVDQTLALNTTARRHVYYAAGVAARNTTAAYTKWFSFNDPDVDIEVANEDAVPLKRGHVLHGFPREQTSGNDNSDDNSDDDSDDVPVDALRDAFVGRLFWYLGESHYAHARPTLFVEERQDIASDDYDEIVAQLRNIGVKKKRARRMAREITGDK